MAACNSDWQGFGLVVIVLCMWATTRNRGQMTNGSYVIVIPLPARLYNSNIPSWGVVILHIGVGRSPIPVCKTTSHGGILLLYNLACYLGNITVQEKRDMGNILRCCLGNRLYRQFSKYNSSLIVTIH